VTSAAKHFVQLASDALQHGLLSLPLVTSRMEPFDQRHRDAQSTHAREHSLLNRSAARRFRITHFDDRKSLDHRFVLCNLTIIFLVQWIRGFLEIGWKIAHEEAKRASRRGGLPQAGFRRRRSITGAIGLASMLPVAVQRCIQITTTLGLIPKKKFRRLAPRCPAQAQGEARTTLTILLTAIVVC
jgi:hypothetical protein